MGVMNKQKMEESNFLDEYRKAGWKLCSKIIGIKEEKTTMDKQELIEELKCLEVKTGSLDYLKGANYATERAISLAKQLDEPKKVVVPKFVADWLTDLRGQISNVKLNSGAVFMTFIGRQLERYYDEEYSFLTEKIESWLTVPKNKVKLMSAIDNGYEVEKEPIIHELKILPEYFEAVVSGNKRFEIRKNDRNYKKGDILRLNEYQDGQYTGDVYVAEITYITNYAQQDGYIVLGIKGKQVTNEN